MTFTWLRGRTKESDWTWLGFRHEKWPRVQPVFLGPDLHLRWRLVIQNSGKISQMTIRLIHVRKKGHKVHRKLGGRFTQVSSPEHMELFFDFTFGCQSDFWRLQPEGKRFSHEIAMFRCYGHVSCCLLRFPSSFQLQKKIFLGNHPSFG